MRRVWLIVGLIGGLIELLLPTSVFACGPGNGLRELAELAASDSPELSAKSIARLRAFGPRGLAAILQRHLSFAQSTSGKPAEARWQAAIDAVGGQFQCSTSQLYWYTDLELAKLAARRSGKPIISLHMLGKLTDEFSCANSRFFRSTLYTNPEIAKALRENFVLHWHSVRPVPKVTVDFGDGRKLESTVTGNSIHYVLDAEGRPLDGLPGLYGPKAFSRWLADVRQLAVEVATVSAADRESTLAAAHRNRMTLIDTLWQSDREQLGLPQSVESLDDQAWAKVAALHAGDAKLDPATQAVILARAPLAATAGRLAITKCVVENPLVAMLRKLQGTIALDSVRNEYTFHRRIHEWYANGQCDGELARLNDRIYAELFLTPSSDPWLGLLPGENYSGLDSGGVSLRKTELAGTNQAE